MRFLLCCLLTSLLLTLLSTKNAQAVCTVGASSGAVSCICDSSTSSTSSSSGAAGLSGEVFATTVGTHNWKPPASLLGKEIRVLAIGGGGAGGNSYTNRAGGGGGGLCHSFPYVVTSTDLTNGLTIRVGAGGTNAGNGGDSFVAPHGTTNYICLAGGGKGGGINTNVAGGLGGAANGTGRGGNGGNGGISSWCDGLGTPNAGGGGGAGGYSGKGGDGGYQEGGDCSVSSSQVGPTAGASGGGGGGVAGQHVDVGGFAGGAVGAFGQGENGTGVSELLCGMPGSDGEGRANASLDDSRNCYFYGNAGLKFGAGGAHHRVFPNNPKPGIGGQGAVRIIWGPDRFWPDHNVKHQEGTVITY